MDKDDPYFDEQSFLAHAYNPLHAIFDISRLTKPRAPHFITMHEPAVSVTGRTLRYKPGTHMPKDAEVANDNRFDSLAALARSSERADAIVLMPFDGRGSELAKLEKNLETILRFAQVGTMKSLWDPAYVGQPLLLHQRAGAKIRTLVQNLALRKTMAVKASELYQTIARNADIAEHLKWNHEDWNPSYDRSVPDYDLMSEDDLLKRVGDDGVDRYRLSQIGSATVNIPAGLRNSLKITQWAALKEHYVKIGENFHFITLPTMPERQHPIMGFGHSTLLTPGGLGTQFEWLSTALNNVRVLQGKRGFYPGFEDAIRPIFAMNSRVNGGDARYYDFLSREIDSVHGMFNKEALDSMGVVLLFSEQEAKEAIAAHARDKGYDVSLQMAA